MTKYHYNRGGTGRAACNKSLLLATGKRTNRRMSAKAVRRNGWTGHVCKHCLEIVRKEEANASRCRKR